MANWCLATGLSPDWYSSLTMRERQAFIDELKRQQGK